MADGPQFVSHGLPFSPSAFALSSHTSLVVVASSESRQLLALRFNIEAQNLQKAWSTELPAGDELVSSLVWSPSGELLFAVCGGEIVVISPTNLNRKAVTQVVSTTQKIVALSITELNEENDTKTALLLTDLEPSLPSSDENAVNPNDLLQLNEAELQLTACLLDDNTVVVLGDVLVPLLRLDLGDLCVFPLNSLSRVLISDKREVIMAGDYTIRRDAVPFIGVLSSSILQEDTVTLFDVVKLSANVEGLRRYLMTVVRQLTDSCRDLFYDFNKELEVMVERRAEARLPFSLGTALMQLLLTGKSDDTIMDYLQHTLGENGVEKMQFNLADAVQQVDDLIGSKIAVCLQHLVVQMHHLDKLLEDIGLHEVLSSAQRTVTSLGISVSHLHTLLLTDQRRVVVFLRFLSDTVSALSTGRSPSTTHSSSFGEILQIRDFINSTFKFDKYVKFGQVTEFLAGGEISDQDLYPDNEWVKLVNSSAALKNSTVLGPHNQPLSISKLLDQLVEQLADVSKQVVATLSNSFELTRTLKTPGPVEDLITEGDRLTALCRSARSTADSAFVLLSPLANFSTCAVRHLQMPSGKIAQAKIQSSELLGVLIQAVDGSTTYCLIQQTPAVHLPLTTGLTGVTTLAPLPAMTEASVYSISLPAETSRLVSVSRNSRKYVSACMLAAKSTLLAVRVSKAALKKSR